MAKLVVNIPEQSKKYYPVLLDNIDKITSLIPFNTSQIIIITDNKVKKLFGKNLLIRLKEMNRECLLLSFPAGEKHKNDHTKQIIEKKMLEIHCDRNAIIIALGGGVVGDIAGFIAATFLRGIRYIQVPTTLLAMIDSSVGGKTGINTGQGKNLIGAIYQPIGVLTDINFLNSLPKNHKINGLIEALKIFLTHDAKSFFYINNHLEKFFSNDILFLKSIIQRAIRIKADIVFRDEKESGERKLLNFGHTIGHALEKLSDYTILHGVAVGYGILWESILSNLLGLLSDTELNTIKTLLNNLGISGKKLKKFSVKDVINATQNDKKVYNHQVHYILLKKIGHAHIDNHAYTHPVSNDIIQKSYQKIIEG